MEYRDISRAEFRIFFFGKYYLKNREISGIFFHDDLRRLNK